MGSLDDLALADLLRTDLLPEIEEVNNLGGGCGGGGCWPGIGTILGWGDQHLQVAPTMVATAGPPFSRSTAECQQTTAQVRRPNPCLKGLH